MQHIERKGKKMHFSVPVLTISERPDYASSYVIRTCIYNLFSSQNTGNKANNFCFLSSLLTLIVGACLPIHIMGEVSWEPK